MPQIGSNFFRVQDAESHSVLTEDGFLAGLDDEYGQRWVELPAKGSQSFNIDTQQYLADHLDWNCPDPSPFISVYTEWDAAETEALRRAQQGNYGVRIYEIDVAQLNRCRVQWRSVRKLAKALGLWVEQNAWHNSLHEVVILHEIPGSAIEGYHTFTTD